MSSGSPYSFKMPIDRENIGLMGTTLLFCCCFSFGFTVVLRSEGNGNFGKYTYGCKSENLFVVLISSIFCPRPSLDLAIHSLNVSGLPTVADKAKIGIDLLNNNKRS